MVWIAHRLEPTMSATILAIGSVRAKTYKDLRLEVIRLGHRPKITRVSIEGDAVQFGGNFFDIDYMNGALSRMSDKELGEYLESEYNRISEGMSRALRQLPPLYAYVMTESHWLDWSTRLRGAPRVLYNLLSDEYPSSVRFVVRQDTGALELV